ncbi:MAG: 23S rRNA (uracil(1939)-C(5))-methyltransferase RlmD [Chlamydiales bacterium]|nr:23S rRNA (uracil(1939)-C(5))-methyltransferase RlmD [Chlamydiales bacterium]
MEGTGVKVASKLSIQSDEAVEPRCPHFGKCGGCKYQHIAYDEQLAQKEAFVRALFSRETDPILACEPPWRYRNKMEFSFSQARSGDKFLGLMRKKSRVENLEACHLTSPWFIDLLGRVRAWFAESGLDAYHPPTDRGTLRTLTVREGVRTGEKMVILTISGNPDFKPSERQIADFEDAVGEVDSLILRKQIIAKKTPTRFEETLLKGREAIHEKLYDPNGNLFAFRIRAASFFQPNTVQAEALYRVALEYADLHEEETLFDLYCGTGTIGIFASKSVKKVRGIEIVPEAVEDALENLKLNGVRNMEISVGDVAASLSKENPSTVIIDPPRAGLSPEAVNYLISLKPKKIVYISCNPSTQAENCLLLERAGYRVERLAPVDQFPHTPHVENVALLRKI